MKNIYNDILYKYQKSAVDKSLLHDRFALWMAPGTGKSFTSLSIAQIKEYKKILVVCQKSKKTDWQEDIEKNLGIKTAVLGGGKVKDDKMLASFTEGAIIANYETVWRRELDIDSDWIIIIDESQYLKSHKSKIGKWGAKETRKAGGVLLLSGTPAKSNDDFYNQLVMLGMNKKYKDYIGEYCITEEFKLPTMRWPVTQVVGDKKRDELLSIIDKFSFSITTEEAVDLPKQNYIDIKLENEKPNTYANVKKHSIYKELAIPNPGVLFMRLRQLASGYIEEYKDISKHKIDALDDLLESNENNMTVFYNFVQELEDIKAVCEAKGIKVFEFNGAVKNGYDSLDYDGRFIIACQYQSAAEGLNLNHVNNQVYYSPPTSFMKYKQSLARVHRIGQDKPVFYYRFITKNTIEEKMYNNLEKGKDYDEKIFEKYFDLEKGK